MLKTKSAKLLQHTDTQLLQEKYNELLKQ